MPSRISYRVFVDRSVKYYSTGEKKRFRSIVDNITKRGHEVGFHPGYASFFNNITWRKEKEELESVINTKVLEGRQHYLRFKMPETFVLWEENRMEYDSTLSYFDVEGFRCGTGDSFPVFNFIERKTYKLKERPLIVMDATLVSYRDYTIEKIRNKTYSSKPRSTIVVIFSRRFITLLGNGFIKSRLHCFRAGVNQCIYPILFSVLFIVYRY